MFIYIQIDAQHPLNKPLTKRETDNRSWLYAQLLFWSVEILLRVYIAYYQYDYILIQQFNKKIMELQRFKLLPCDGIEASHSPYRFIPTLPIVVKLISGICQPVRCRYELPTFLQYLSYLMLLRFDIRVCQQRENVIAAKEKVSTPILAMISSISSHISISNLLRLLRIIFCKASVCSSDVANHIRLSFSVDSCLCCKW